LGEVNIDAGLIIKRMNGTLDGLDTGLTVHTLNLYIHDLQVLVVIKKQTAANLPARPAALDWCGLSRAHRV
jgi:hypothetical protein